MRPKLVQRENDARLDREELSTGEKGGLGAMSKSSCCHSCGKTTALSVPGFQTAGTPKELSVAVLRRQERSEANGGTVSFMAALMDLEGEEVDDEKGTVDVVNEDGAPRELSGQVSPHEVGRIHT